jgi:hypothetical protein
VVHFVHVYVIEPHPGSPDPNPYRGGSDGGIDAPRQPRAYDDRLTLAQQTAGFLEGAQMMLVDDLAPRQRNNPVWCTYGPGANCGYLIAQDGTLVEAQLWVKPDEIRDAIDRILD